jgi:hypothetical protein
MRSRGLGGVCIALVIACVGPSTAAGEPQGASPAPRSAAPPPAEAAREGRPSGWCGTVAPDLSLVVTVEARSLEAATRRA